MGPVNQYLQPLSSPSYTAHALLATLLLALASACIPVTLIEAHPVRPISAAAGPIAASVEWAGVYDNEIVIVVTLSGPESSRITRAALVQQGPSAAGDCPAYAELCAVSDQRFSVGTAARVLGDGPRFRLSFPRYGASRELASKPELLLEVKAPQGAAKVLELDLAREVAFRSGDWGIGGAIRFRAPGFVNAHFGRAATGELGADRWLGSTRLRLSYEIGYSGCRGANPVEIAGCASDDGLVPLGGQFSATHYVDLGAPVTLGVGMGYGVLAILARDSAAPPDEPAPPAPLLHGPRLALLLVATPPQVPRFSLEPPKLAAGLELSLELLGHHAFEQPSLIVGAAYTFTAAF